MNLDSLDLENVYMSNTDMSIFMKILVTNINLQFIINFCIILDCKNVIRLQLLFLKKFHLKQNQILKTYIIQ
jgi:hypothetical protein